MRRRRVAPDGTNSVKIAPSVLAADFARMGEQVAEAVDGGADYIHVDVMDGRFVPPITFGVQMVEAIKRHAGSVPLDVHLMIHEPIRLIPDFAEAGADLLVVHAEACEDLAGTVSAIKQRGGRAGVAVRPDSPVDLLLPVLGDLDLALVMSVHPGWAAQKYIADVEPKVVSLRALIDERGLSTELEMDGGISEETAARAAAAGADVLVTGSAVYGRTEPVGTRIRAIREAAAPLRG